MPNRILREGILTSAGVNTLDAGGERFYRRLMSVVDDYGRFDGRPSIIRAACFPLLLDKVREADCSRWMAECQKAGLIVLYEADSKPYVQLLKLGEPRAKRSKYPGPNGAAGICAHVRADAPALRLSSSSSSSPLASGVGAGESGGMAAKRGKIREAIVKRGQNP